MASQIFGYPPSQGAREAAWRPSLWLWEVFGEGVLAPMGGWAKMCSSLRPARHRNPKMRKVTARARRCRLGALRVLLYIVGIECDAVFGVGSDPTVRHT